MNNKKKQSYKENFDVDETTKSRFQTAYGKVASGLTAAYDYIENSDILSGDTSFNGTDVAETDIYSGEYKFLDRILYGGLCSGAIVIPTNFIKIIFTIIFPPLGTILNIIENEILETFPWITWNTLKKLFDIENLNKIIYTLVLTSMFYVPGLVYALAHLTTSTEDSMRGMLECDSKTGECVEV